MMNWMAYQHGRNLLENIDGLGRRGVLVWLIGLGHGEFLILDGGG